MSRIIERIEELEADIKAVESRMKQFDNEILRLQALKEFGQMYLDAFRSQKWELENELLACNEYDHLGVCDISLSEVLEDKKRVPHPVAPVTDEKEIREAILASIYQLKNYKKEILELERMKKNTRARLDETLAHKQWLKGKNGGVL